MLTIAQIAAILGLLAAFGVGQPTVDQVAIILNNQATSTMQDATQNSTGPVSSTPAPEPTVQPAPTAPAAAAPESQARIELVSPIPSKGLGRNDYASSTVVQDERHYIYLGAIVYGADGLPTKTATVNISATDGEQDAIQVGTGEVMNLWVDGQKRQVPVYTYNYEFHTSGKHTITFTAGELSASAEVQVK